MSTQAHKLPVPAGITARRHRASLFSLDRHAPVIAPAVPKVGLDEICLSYRTEKGERLLALDRISLQVKAGEFVCIVGDRKSVV